MDPGQLERAIADDASTQQRGRGFIGEAAGDGEDIVGTSRHRLCKPAITIPSGELCLFTQILETRSAAVTATTCGAHPTHTYPRPNCPVVDTGAKRPDSAHNLMTGDNWQPTGHYVTFDDL